MDRIAVAALIALAALVMTPGIGSGLLAREAAPSIAPLATASAPPAPAGSRVLSLLLTLEALRSAPNVLDSRKSEPIGL